MSFSAAFARGYAIGDAAKKRKTIARFFDKFDEMTKDDSEPAAEEIGGISVPDSVITERGALDIQPLSEVEPPAVDAVGAIDARSPSAKRMAPAPTPPASALDLGGDPAAVTAETPAASVAAPRAIPVGENVRKFQKSLTQGDIKNLDKLALDAARASGDWEVFNALKKTGDSLLQGKVLSYLGKAQVALTNGDTEQAETNLRKAYRNVPDGQELKTQRDRKTGMLTIKNPADGKPIELTPERIGNFATMIYDQEGWSKIMRQETKDAAAAKMEERKIAVSEGSLKVDQGRLNLLGEELGVKGRELELKELAGPMERMETYQRGLYYGALRDQAQTAAKQGKTQEFLTESVAMGKSIDESIKAYTTPGTNPISGEPNPDWKPPADIMVSDPGSMTGRRPLAPDELRNTAAFAQTIGISNLGMIGPELATSAAMQIVKAQVDPDNFNVVVENGIMTVPFRGMQIPVQLPPSLLQALAKQQQNATTPTPSGLFPSPQQFLQE
jgi:hypothetical protein